MGIVIKESSKRGKLMVKVFIIGSLGKYIKVNGQMVLKKDMEYGQIF